MLLAEKPNLVSLNRHEVWLLTDSRVHTVHAQLQAEI